MKICVCAISKNEENFVKRFCESATSADIILICDTGSTDNTIKLAKEYGATVHNIFVEPWRFDMARNIALGLIPEDIDICISLDLDEVLVPGWKEEIEKVWIPKETNILQHLFKDTNIELPYETVRVFSRFGWMWKGICHERLYLDPRIEREWKSTDFVLIEHNPNLNKSRIYMDFIKADIVENPSDLISRYYLARQLYNCGSYKECINEIDELESLILDIKDKGFLNGPYFSKYELCYLYGLKASCFIYLKNEDKAEENYKLACDMNLGLRRPIIALAKLYFNQKKNALCYKYCKKAIKITDRLNRREESDPELWNEEIFKLTAIAAYKLGKMDKAIEFRNKVKK